MPKWLGSTLNPDFSIPQEHQWMRQWERVCRWCLRAKDIEKRSNEIALTAEDMDFLIAYFQNCNHLKDWMQSSRPNLMEKLQALIDGNIEMRYCRNICDGFKHKQLDEKRHPDPDFSWFREFDAFEKEIIPTKPAIHYWIV
jgi:hypothetical protein